MSRMGLSRGMAQTTTTRSEKIKVSAAARDAILESLDDSRSSLTEAQVRIELDRRAAERVSKRSSRL